MNRRCRICDKLISRGYYCDKCYGYLRKHPEGIYPLPPEKEMHYASNGDPICHICGMAARKLGNHIRNSHNISPTEYKDKFKLYHNTRLSNDDYIDVMVKHNKKNIEIVRENLVVKGEKTRIKKGGSLNGRKFQYKINKKSV